MDWDNLKVALAISRLGSLTQAAQALGIDQSTAGRRLSALEGDLGVILFVRSKTGFALTDAGETAIKQAVEVERRIERLMDEVTPSDEGPVGFVRLLGNAWTMDRLARTVMAPFMAAHPRLDLRIMTLTPRSRVRGEASLSLWFEVEPRDGEFAVKLGEVPYAVYRSRDSEAADLGWITFYDEDALRPSIASVHRRLRTRGDRQRVTATDAGIMLSAIRSGVGKGLLPMCIAEEDEQLVRTKEGEPEFVRTLHLHAHPDTIEAARVQATIRWLRESFPAVFQPAQ
ncbi:LysR family transcriptional regulator [Pelagibius litoralis]|uniref:LysR family transcriptional regulator n=1 Tax=Pelagibius litoralis TaxID=374515 RepID=A0A967KCB9_9PROT|nr:LysR family transcriptional regulator [Pelagibius litoralis]NIA69585.1 LysR family transcriptional regulator [Pelagibius litoralis]